ncbi:glycine cleavage system aminomethyltransferase GcvT [Paracoccus tegillarcae]|uniref:aminomethyltransferase n=1 Tax=Paracoccus tegillarcae TaxID=1529068 RepID=A0A2K9ENR1_9RHOB|nr:glycine cleavage system aminomethyltransferase GcvT [Paracoccus tegillarcae]AUH33295.1 glycine cleavage system protein T [Paracoccus tegillarcae]
MAEDLKRTGLYDLHVAQGAKMVPFAGWDMPVQYPQGVLGEHLHTREAAGLFDVSHMGQVRIVPKDGDMASAALALESLIAADVLSLPEGRQRYGLFTDDEGGILDDLMFANRGDHYLLVVNAARADHDIPHLQSLDAVQVEPITDRGLLALQGPKAVAVLQQVLPGVEAMKFMDVATFDWDGAGLWVSRSGYTGEDGFEISVPQDKLAGFAQALLDQPEVMPIGLAARDSLRLEAGMPLYGHDLTEETTLVEAALTWSIGKARRQGGAREGGFPGAAHVLDQIAQGSIATRRVGLRPEGRAPIREGVAIFDAETGGTQIGTVCSGGFGPSVGGPVAMAYLPADLSSDAQVWAELRGKRMPVRLAAMPFISPSYKR